MRPLNTAGVIRELLEAHVEPPADDSLPLELPSLALVLLAEALEARFDFRVRATELVPENFSSIARVAAFVERKVAEL